MKNPFRYLLESIYSDASEDPVVMPESELSEFYRFVIAHFSVARQQVSRNAFLGEKITTHSGQGMDFSETKLYVAGDDTRLINWKQTAKTGELISNKFYKESENTDYIMLDERRAMYFGTKVQPKLAAAIKVAMISAIQSLAQNKKVKIVALTDSLQVSGLIEDYNSILPYFSLIARKRSFESSNEKPLSDLIRLIKKLNPQFATINIISDFHDFNTDDAKLIKALNVKNEVTMMAINDPIETTLPDLIPVNYQALSDKGSINVTNNRRLGRLSRHINESNKKIKTLLTDCAENIQYIETIDADKKLIKACGFGY